MVRLKLAWITPLVLACLASCQLVGGTPLVVTPGAPQSPGDSPRPGMFDSPAPAPTEAPATQPGVTGRYQPSYDPLDVALAGPGYFVLATREQPRGFEDLCFTRQGDFTATFVPQASPGPASGGWNVGGPGAWRLESRDGLIVQGLAYAGDDTAPVPPESRSTDFELAFTLGGSGALRVKVGPLLLETQTSDALAPGFTLRGQLRNFGQAPLDAEGRARQLFLVVAQFERPQGLLATAGSPYLRYTRGQGAVSVGVAGERAARGTLARPVGESTLVRPGYLER